MSQLQMSRGGSLLVKLDVLKKQLGESTNAQLPGLAAETAGAALHQCVQQVSQPSLMQSSAAVLGEVLQSAAAQVASCSGAVINSAVQTAARNLMTDGMPGLFLQVISNQAEVDKKDLPALVDAKIAESRNTSVMALVEQVMERYLVGCNQKAVATLSHFALLEAVSILLQTEVMPLLQRLTVDAFSQHLLKLLNSEPLSPAPGQSTQDAFKRVANVTSAQAMQSSISPIQIEVMSFPNQVPSAAMVLQPGPAPHITSTTTTSPAPVLAAAPVYFWDGNTGPWKYLNFPSSVAGTTTAPRPSVVDRLPDNLLVKVLSMVEPAERLTTCSHVCRKWRQLSRSQAAWRCESLLFEPDDVHSVILVMHFAPCLGTLDLRRLGSSESPDVLASVLAALLQSSCVVQKLCIAAEGLKASVVVELLVKFGAHLKDLDLTTSPELCDLDDPKDPRCCWALNVIDSMPALVRLRLAGDFSVEFNFGPRKLGAPRRALEVLDLGEYSSHSHHTACSLISAHLPSLTSATVPSCAGMDEMVTLSLCPKLLNLTVPVDVLERAAPPSLSRIARLTLRPARTDTLRAYRSSSDLGRTPPPLLPLLRELTLDGVRDLADVPRPVRKAFRQVRSVTFRATNMECEKVLAVLRGMPALEELVLFREARMNASYAMSALPKVAPKLKSLRVLRTLQCHGRVCWRPSFDFFLRSYPKGTIFLDLMCNCSCEEAPASP